MKQNEIKNNPKYFSIFSNRNNDESNSIIYFSDIYKFLIKLLLLNYCFCK